MRWLLPQEGARSSEPLVFLPGWGFDGRVWGLAANPEPVLAPAEFYDPFTLVDGLVACLARQGLQRCRLVGWSLGGLAALDFAGRYPERVAALTLLGVRAHWPGAELGAISEELERDPAAFMSSFYRKVFAGYREGYDRFQRELEADLVARSGTDRDLLRRGLDYLAQTGEITARSEQSRAANKNPFPCCCLHGRRDLIAPAAQRLQLTGGESLLLAHAGHALFLEDCLSLVNGCKNGN